MSLENSFNPTQYVPIAEEVPSSSLSQTAPDWYSPQEPTADFNRPPQGPAPVTFSVVGNDVNVWYGPTLVLNSRDCEQVQISLSGSISMSSFKKHVRFARSTAGALDLTLPYNAHFTKSVAGAVDMIYGDGSRFSKSVAGAIRMDYASDGTCYWRSVAGNVCVRFANGQVLCKNAAGVFVDRTLTGFDNIVIDNGCCCFGVPW
jgi:hypothetical protein